MKSGMKGKYQGSQYGGHPRTIELRHYLFDTATVNEPQRPIRQHLHRFSYSLSLNRGNAQLIVHVDLTRLNNVAVMLESHRTKQRMMAIHYCR